jgi:hypothetical protein
VGPRAKLDVEVKRKITLPTGNQTHLVTVLYEICSSDSGSDIEGSLLCCDSVWTCRLCKR